MSKLFTTPALAYLVHERSAWRLETDSVARKSSVQVCIAAVRVADREIVVTGDGNVLALNIAQGGNEHQVAEVHHGGVDDKGHRLQFLPADLIMSQRQLVVTASDDTKLSNSVRQTASVDPMLVAANVADLLGQKRQVSVQNSNDQITLLEEPISGPERVEFVTVTLKGRGHSRDYGVFVGGAETYVVEMATAGRKLFVTGRMVTLTEGKVQKISKTAMLKVIKGSTTPKTPRAKNRTRRSAA